MCNKCMLSSIYHFNFWLLASIPGWGLKPFLFVLNWCTRRMLSHYYYTMYCCIGEPTSALLRSHCEHFVFDVSFQHLLSSPFRLSPWIIHCFPIFSGSAYHLGLNKSRMVQIQSEWNARRHLLGLLGETSVSSFDSMARLRAARGIAQPWVQFTDEGGLEEAEQDGENASLHAYCWWAGPEVGHAPRLAVRQAKDFLLLLQACVGFSVAMKRFLIHSDHFCSIFEILGKFQRELAKSKDLQAIHLMNDIGSFEA